MQTLSETQRHLWHILKHCDAATLSPHDHEAVTNAIEYVKRIEHVLSTNKFKCTEIAHFLLTGEEMFGEDWGK